MDHGLWYGRSADSRSSGRQGGLSTVARTTAFAMLMTLEMASETVRSCKTPVAHIAGIWSSTCICIFSAGTPQFFRLWSVRDLSCL